MNIKETSPIHTGTKSQMYDAKKAEALLSSHMPRHIANAEKVHVSWHLKIMQLLFGRWFVMRVQD